MYDLGYSAREALNEDLQEKLDDLIENIPVHFKIDGMPVNPEEGTGEIDRTGGEINIDMIFGIKRIIQRHPEEYREELHWPLFNDQERDEIENAKAVALMKGAA